MTDSPIEFSWKRRGPRRSTRFRAVVESLDRRQLMATDVTGVSVMYVNGTARNPLPVYGAPQTPPFGTLGAIYPLQPVGTPVPLVTLTSSSPDPLSSTGYSGTVNWGDGSATDVALFGTFTSPGLIPQPVNTLFVNGPDHTYQTPGLYPITVSVTAPGDSAATVYHSTASITLAVSGHLNPLSDSGFFNNDSITSVRKVDYVGTTLPGTTVVLSAMNASTGKTVVVGSGVADASGVWNVTTTPLADGSYQIPGLRPQPGGRYR